MLEGLDELRCQINEIDDEMRALFERRMACSAQVARTKQAAGLPVLDATREEEVIRTNRSRLQNTGLSTYYTKYLRQLMSLSRAWQAEILSEDTVAYQGAEGGFGHQVMHTLYPHAKGLSQPTFAAVFEAVEAGEAAFGVVPFENSGTGDVAGVLDLCYNHGLYITAMYDLPVTQNLLGLPRATLSGIRQVLSHEQALQQCRRFVEGLGAQPRPFENTATAAKYVAESGDETLGAIASREAAGRYGLEVLCADIATEAENTTRFIVVGRKAAAGGERVSLLVTISNEVGSLEKVIRAISAAGMNMEAIKSRPMPHRPWEYYFYIELAGAPGEEATRQLLQALGGICVSARLLGRYTRTVQEAAE